MLSYILTIADNARIFTDYLRRYGRDLTNDKLAFDSLAADLNQSECTYTGLFDCLDFLLSRLKPDTDLLQILYDIRGTHEYHAFLSDIINHHLEVSI